jgi:hypothetical protein
LEFEQADATTTEDMEHRLGLTISRNLACWVAI